MPPFPLPTAWAVGLDFLAWFAIHMGAAWVGSRLPGSVLQAGGYLYRVRQWERDTRLYSGVLRVNRWKHLLPDGAAWFPRGFPKRVMQSASRDYLETFVIETCRAELTHWLAMVPVPVFFLWNKWPVGVFMIFYALAANMPCILAQRYNRARLVRVLAKAR